MSDDVEKGSDGGVCTECGGTGLVAVYLYPRKPGQTTEEATPDRLIFIRACNAGPAGTSPPAVFGPGGSEDLDRYSSRRMVMRPTSENRTSETV